MRTCLCLVILAFGLWGCQGQEEIVGQWKYGRDTVVFRGDHTYLEKDPKGEVTGMWVQTGRVVTLTPEAVAGKPVGEYRSSFLGKVKKDAAKSIFNKVFDQWLAVNDFKLNADGISMDIVDPSGQRRDSMMRSAPAPKS